MLELPNKKRYGASHEHNEYDHESEAARALLFLLFRQQWLENFFGLLDFSLLDHFLLVLERLVLLDYFFGDGDVGVLPLEFSLDVIVNFVEVVPVLVF